MTLPLCVCLFRPSLLSTISPTSLSSFSSALIYPSLPLPPQLAEAFFLANHRTGYTLKPDFLRQGQPFDCLSKSFPDQVAYKVDIDLLQSQYMSKGKAINVQLVGVPIDTHETETVDLATVSEDTPRSLFSGTVSLAS
jgi:hypothetical protein